MASADTAFDPVRIVVPTPFSIGPVNAWLVQGADAIAVVDVGPNHPDSVAALEAGLALEGLRPQDVDLVVVTHQHYDHVGAAGILRDLWGAELAVLEPLARYVEDGRASNEAEDRFATEIMRLHGVPEVVIDTLWQRAQAFWHLGCESPVDRVLHDGELLDLGGGTALRVLHRPGHSPTDTIFVHEASSAALVGDHLLGPISSNPIIHRPLDAPADAARRPRTLVRYIESMRATRELGLAAALPGHRTPIEDVAALIDLRLAEHQERADAIHAALAGGPLTAYELTAILWRNLPVDQVYLGVSEVLGHVDLLADEGRVSETLGDDGLVRLAAARA